MSWGRFDEKAAARCVLVGSAPSLTPRLPLGSLAHARAQMRGCHVAPGVAMSAVLWFVLEHFGIRGVVFNIQASDV